MGCDGPTLLSVFTLTPTLSHQGRGDIAAARVSPVESEGILPFTPPPRGIPCVRFAPRPLTLREGDVGLGVLGLFGLAGDGSSVAKEDCRTGLSV